MKTSLRHLLPSSRQAQHGAAAVEFALVAMILFSLLLGIMEFGRLMFTWNSAVEATRRGARLAVVCDMNVAKIRTSMQKFVPMISTNDITVNYAPSGCTGAANCQSVTVSISSNAPAFRYALPFINQSWRIPAFSTTLTRESLTTGIGTDANPDC
ncbi:TadE/TadG family type IV pilus assembly protein [Vogesella sp. LYT5W]|uniref:TadE/TadG family type IV pilus assembly protein n=1 Tax=Vogesella margarita TaxID=2984199 RepID=A0ABT5IRC5_9NEIS|nr:TadE/TadG family type IV pilus assembly protein [Vogesella margarita]MDC7715124.1 TadE/TadG family type IV pilus assembly protein [Vogesella margarita]